MCLLHNRCVHHTSQGFSLVCSHGNINTFAQASQKTKKFTQQNHLKNTSSSLGHFAPFYFLSIIVSIRTNHFSFSLKILLTYILLGVISQCFWANSINVFCVQCLEFNSLNSQNLCFYALINVTSFPFYLSPSSKVTIRSP